MSSCRQFSHEFCAGVGCNCVTLHDAGGCVHRAQCGGVRPVLGGPAKRTPRPEKQGSQGLASLTDVERRVLTEFAVGGPSGSIGKRLGMSGAKVRSLRQRICKKLNLKFVEGVDVVTEFARNAGAGLLEP